MYVCMYVTGVIFDGGLTHVLFVSHLILVQFTPFELLLAFALKCDDHKTNEDIDHKEGNDDDVDNVINGYPWPVILIRTLVYFSGVDRILQNPIEKSKQQI